MWFFTIFIDYLAILYFLWWVMTLQALSCVHAHVAMATANRKFETVDPGFDGVGRTRPDGQPMVGVLLSPLV